VVTFNPETGQPVFTAYFKFDSETQKLIAAIMQDIPASDCDGRPWTAVYFRKPGQYFIEGQNLDVMLAASDQELIEQLAAAVALNVHWASPYDSTRVVKNHHFGKVPRRRIVEAIQRRVWRIEATKRGLHLDRAVTSEPSHKITFGLSDGSIIITAESLVQGEPTFVYTNGYWDQKS